MKRFLIERNIPGGRQLSGQELKDASATSNAALAELASKVQWCSPMWSTTRPSASTSPTTSRRFMNHAQLSGFPASKVVEVRNVIDPMTAI